MLNLSLYDAAIADFDASIELNPDEAETRMKRAQAYSELGRYSDALRDLDAAIDLYPDHRPMLPCERERLRGLAAIEDYTREIQLHANRPDALLPSRVREVSAEGIRRRHSRL